MAEVYTRHFADRLHKDMVIASNSRGDHGAVIVSDPFRRINPVTNAIHVIAQGRLVSNQTEVELVFTPSELVFAYDPYEKEM